MALVWAGRPGGRPLGAAQPDLIDTVGVVFLRRFSFRGVFPAISGPSCCCSAAARPCSLRSWLPSTKLGVLHRSVKRPTLTTPDRLLWAWLCRIWPEWRSALVIVKLDTVLAQHRKAFRLFWTWKKLTGAPELVGLFDAIGIGQWFRYVTGSIEVASAVALLVPAWAALGALLLIPTMVGAVFTHLFIVGGSAVPATVLLIGALAIAWARRDQLASVLSRQS
jgi:putative oxidoreductase